MIAAMTLFKIVGSLWTINIKATETINLSATGSKKAPSFEV
jgi:hypothetical protein